MEAGAPRRIVPILAGGGTRLPAHVGVLRALDELELDYGHIVGVSGGSIVAALRAYGLDNDQIKALALDVDFRQFRGFSLYQLLFHGGLSSGNHFEQWMGRQLDHARFGDLQLDLHVVATDVRTGLPVLFDKSHTPDMPVATAVRFSMGIPLLFSFKQYRDHLLVDGSILAEEALRLPWGGDDEPICCFRLRNQGGNQGRRENPWFPLPGYLNMLIRTFMTTLSREFVIDSNWNSTVVIETEGFSPTDFRVSRRRKEQLFERGYRTTLDYLPLKMMRSSGEAAPNLTP